MSKFLYILGLVGSGILALVFTILAMDPKTTEMAAAVPIPILIALITHLAFVYKFWNSIQDGHPRMTPGKAIGFLFIPFFNIYWLFQVYPGFATDYNRYIQEKGIQVRPLSQGLLTTMAIFILISIPVVNWIVQAMAISKICDAVNAIKGK
ncbi:MAG: hypothetical protein U1F66_11020 [bacterium]